MHLAHTRSSDPCTTFITTAALLPARKLSNVTTKFWKTWFHEMLSVRTFVAYEYLRSGRLMSEFMGV